MGCCSSTSNNGLNVDNTQSADEHTAVKESETYREGGNVNSREPKSHNDDAKECQSSEMQDSNNDINNKVM